MNSEIENLKLEIQVLKKRIEVLEGIERRRKITRIVKIVIYVILVIAILIAGFSLYQKINGYYNDLNNLIKDPFSSFGNSFNLNL